MPNTKAPTLGKVAAYTAEEVAQYGIEVEATLWQRLNSLWQHSKNVWLQRAMLGDNTFANHHAEFLPAALEIQNTPPNVSSQRIGQSIMLLILVTIFWASIGKVDVVAVAEGKIIPSSRVKIIQPLDKGLVRIIYVSEGQVVKQGEPLVELDKTLTASDQSRLQQAYTTALLDEQRWQQLITLLSQQNTSSQWPLQNNIQASASDIQQQQQLLQQQWQQYQAQQGALNSNHEAKQAELESTQAQIQKISQTLPIVEQRAKNYASLLESHMVAKDDYLKIEQERIEQQQTLVALQAQSRQLSAGINEVEKKLAALVAETRAQAWQQLAEVRMRREGLHEELAKATDTNARQILYAPVDGVVQELKINTIGGVVTEAQALMTIVPNDENLEVQAFIDNKDIGYLHAGMPAEIKVQTFPFTQYGVIDAAVKSVTDDALADQEKGLFFAMLLQMNKKTINVNGKPVRLRPGMQVSVEVKIGKRRIIEYLLTPVIKGFSESVRER